MEVKVTIINTCCIFVSEAVTLPCLTMMTLIASEKSLARYVIQTHRHGLVYLDFSKSFKTKQKNHHRVVLLNWCCAHAFTVNAKTIVCQRNNQLLYMQAHENSDISHAIP